MSQITQKKVLLAAPRGYCAGVDRAVITVEKALELYGAPVYVRKQIVHNKHVVSTLEARGAIFVDETDEVPEGKIVVFSAHIHLIDGIADIKNVKVRDENKVAWLSQTTLSVDETLATVAELRKRFPNLIDPPSDDICYATQNRQVAIKQIAPKADLVLVVGSTNSSNSVRLVEVSLEYGAKAAYLIDYAAEAKDEWLAGVNTVGVTSGASVPEILVKDLLNWLAERGFGEVETVTATEEHLLFAIPPELRKDIKAASK